MTELETCVPGANLQKLRNERGRREKEKFPGLMSDAESMTPKVKGEFNFGTEVKVTD